MPVCEDVTREGHKGRRPPWNVRGKSWGSERNEKGKEEEPDVHWQMHTNPPCSLLPEQLRYEVAQVHTPAIRVPPWWTVALLSPHLGIICFNIHIK